MFLTSKVRGGKKGLYFVHDDIALDRPLAIGPYSTSQIDATLFMCQLNSNTAYNRQGLINVISSSEIMGGVAHNEYSVKRLSPHVDLAEVMTCFYPMHVYRHHYYSDFYTSALPEAGSAPPAAALMTFLRK
jgi:hypothetical protein